MSIWLDLLGSKVFYSGRKFRTRVIEFGRGTPLILLHGLGGHAEVFSRNLARLGQHYRAMAIDLVWHGLSSRPCFDGKTMPTYARQFIDLLDSLEIESAHVEGTSQGGWVALWLAIHHPERLKKVILTMPAGVQLSNNFVTQGLVKFRRRSLKVVESPTPKHIRWRLEKFMVSPERVTDELVELRRRFYSDPRDQKALAKAYKSAFWLGRYPKYKILAGDLEKIKNPTLVLWGSHNRGAGPQFGRQIANTIPNAKFVCINDVAHWPQWEHPDRHDAMVLKFLSGR